MGNDLIYFNIIVKAKQEDEWVIYLKVSPIRQLFKIVKLVVVLLAYPDLFCDTHRIINIATPLIISLRCCLGVNVHEPIDRFSLDPYSYPYSCLGHVSL